MLSLITTYVRQTTTGMASRILWPWLGPRNFECIRSFKSWVARKTGLRVQEGPFKGIQYIDESVGSSWAPKVLGTYEHQLHAWVESAIAAGYHRFIDIGCAEGYYAVGMATRCPALKVFAFDSDERARHLSTLLARLNRVGDRVDVGTRCSPDRLADLIVPGSLVLCDIEGGEIELFNKELMPDLRSCDVIVEVHDAGNQTFEQILRKRFSPTHLIDKITYNGAASTPTGSCLTVPWRYGEYSREEGRTMGLTWLRMTARNRNYPPSNANGDCLD